MNLAEKHFNAAMAAWRRYRFEECIVEYQACLKLSPDSVPALCNLGAAYHALRRIDPAIECYRKALAIDPNYGPAVNNLGICLYFQGHFDQAIEQYRRAIALEPKNAGGYRNLGQALAAQGHLDQSLATYAKALELEPSNASIASDRLFTMQFHAGCDAAELLREARLWNQRYAAPLKKLIVAHSNDRSTSRKLRIGYVTPNLRTHSQAPFIYPLLKHHDHSNFEIYCYCSAQLLDDVTLKFKPCADVWRSIVAMNDRDLPALIRRDQIDILVDLTMHMAYNTLLTFAQKPAPVQVTYLAYPGTTGVDAIDSRFTDAYLDPPGETDAFYSEKSVRLPRTFAVFDPLLLDPELPVTPTPAQANGFITFGSLANFFKTNVPMLRLWSRALLRTPHSRLRLLAPQGEARRWVLAALADNGVAAGRVDFVTRQARPQYLAEFAKIDIMLDTLPYNGHTTTLEAVWNGVPIVTRLGATAGGRAGFSVLSNLGLPELAGHSDDQFVQIAANLAADLPRLAEIRRTLRPRMAQSPLMDFPGFAKAVETEYRRMWADFISSKSPAP